MASSRIEKRPHTQKIKVVWNGTRWCPLTVIEKKQIRLIGKKIIRLYKKQERIFKKADKRCEA